MPFKFGKLAGGFLALAALTAAGAPVKVPVPAENNGKVPSWTIRADGKTDVSGVAGGFRFHSPEKTVMVSASEKFPVADFTRVTIRANFKGTGTIQLGFHVYGRKGYICTFPGKKLKLDSPDQSVPLESVQLPGGCSGENAPGDGKPFFGLLCVYAHPGTKGEITDFSYETGKYIPDPEAPIAPPGKRPDVPPMQHRLVLPDTIYAVEGVEMNIYFDNVFLSVNPSAYVFDVDCPKGNNFGRKWSFTPAGNDVGVHSLTLRVISDHGMAACKTVRLMVAPADAGKGRRISLLMVGDSITDVTAFPKRVHSLFHQPGNPELTMVGTRPAPSRSGSMAHEGYAGWAWETFLRSGPFVSGRNGGTELDIPAYFAKCNNGAAPDFITFQLGVNDVFGSDDFRIYNALHHIERSMERLVDAFRKAAPNAVIGIGLPTPCASQDGMGRVYCCGQTKFQYAKNRLMLSRMVMRKYGGSQDPKIRVIPMYHNLDCEYNFPMQEYPVNAGAAEKISMPRDGLHPAPAGGNQLGDTFFAWLKCHLHEGE